MAKLPLMIAEGRLPGRAAAVGIERPDLYNPAPRALLGAGNALEAGGLAVAAIEKNARDTRDVIAGTADAAEELDRYRIELDGDADYKSREGKFRQRAEQVKQRLAEKMSGAAALDFEKSFERSYSILSHSLRDKARKDEIEETAVKLDESNNKILDIALRERDPRKKALHLEQIAANIEAARTANILSKGQADRIHKSTLEKFERLQVTELQRTNPGAALRLLTSETGLKYMDPLAKKELALKVQQDMERRSALASIIARGTVSEAISLLDHGVKPEQLARARELAKAHPDLTARLDTAEGNYYAAVQFRGMDATERRQAASAIAEKERAEGLTNPEASLAARYAQIDKQIRDGFGRDPVGAAMERNAPAAAALADAERAGDPVAFRSALEALVETQQREGVPAHAVKALPKQTATALEAQLTGPASQAQADTIARLQLFYGNEHMPRVMAQLDEGKKLPGHVKVIAALGPKAAGDPDIKRILEAAKVSDGDWAKIIPDEDTRKEARRQVGAAGEAVRAAFIKLPGGAQRFAEFARSAEDVAFSLLADKSAPNAAAAGRQAWDIVHNRHFALAGTVVIPKVNGHPIANPAEIAAYQAFKMATLDKENIAPPPATPSTRLLTAAQRLDQLRAHLRTFGTWVTDRDDRGALLLDGFGAPVANGAGGWVRFDFVAPEKNDEFKAWRGRQPAGGLYERVNPNDPTDPRLRLRTVPR